MKVYIVSYADETGETNDIVAEGSLVCFVKEMIDEGRICELSIKDFTKEHKGMPKTDAEAVGLLTLDGYGVFKRNVYEK